MIIPGMPANILYGDNDYDIIWRYFKNFKERLRRLRAFLLTAKGMSVASLSWSEQDACRA